ncbi:hypothetical protein [Notoacmeibacter sp. MSK16QG-6]|uniref:hypothetical protein n=1 Tax=Notoacmeibacter sp. MSK16QG-6 TaxID=2957982 RepID=UPI00209F9F64|nr:hypothetical protein [Notoacmeibacter sp. MSK16QG-6]MCP1199680.1 hypothetical protein [Notoacmeibacter sp. MSK16QG-6]
MASSGNHANPITKATSSSMSQFVRGVEWDIELIIGIMKSEKNHSQAQTLNAALDALKDIRVSYE